MTISAPAPGSTVAAPGDTVRVQWVGSDVDGDDLLYTALYSSDGGGAWETVEYEISETEIDVLINRAGTAHRAKVIATDGVRSTETVVAFSLAPPGATPSPTPSPTVTPTPGPGPTPVPAAASPISTISVVEVRFDPTLQHNIANLSVVLDGERLAANFLDFYDTTGGLTRWGFPTSEVFEERPGILTQYYQRGVVDCQPEPGHTRLLVRRLAVDFLVGGAGGAPDLLVESNLLSTRSGVRIGPWDHRVANESIEGVSIGFVDFFNRLGGVDAFGFPKTDARRDSHPDATVIAPGLTPGFIRQYFQAAVMEYHPGDPEPVKLGLLGDTLRNMKYPNESWTQIQAFLSAEILGPGDVLRQN